MKKITLIAKVIFYTHILIFNSACKKGEVESPGENEIFLLYKTFNPTSLSVKKGITVTFTNKDNATHTVSSNNTLFYSGKLKSGKSFSYTFNDTGAYYFFCNYHSSQQEQGVIIVQ